MVQLAGVQDRDRAGGVDQLHLVELRSPDQTEVAVGVADREAERQLHEPVIGAADDRADHAVGAAQLVALRDVDVVGRAGDEQLDLGRVVLTVAVGVEDPLLRGRGEAREQRAAVAAVLVVGDDAQPRLLAGQLGEHHSRTVGGAVVDDDDLAVGDARTLQCPEHDVDHRRDGGFVVVTGEERGDGDDGRVHGIARHTASTSSSVISGKQGKDTHSAAQASASGHASRTKPT